MHQLLEPAAAGPRPHPRPAQWQRLALFKLSVTIAASDCTRQQGQPLAVQREIFLAWRCTGRSYYARLPHSPFVSSPDSDMRGHFQSTACALAVALLLRAAGEALPSSPEDPSRLQQVRQAREGQGETWV